MEVPTCPPLSLLQTASSCFVGAGCSCSNGDPAELWRPRCPQAFWSGDWLIAAWLVACVTNQRTLFSLTERGILDGCLSGTIAPIVLPNAQESSQKEIVPGVRYFQDSYVVAKTDTDSSGNVELCNLSGLTSRINGIFPIEPSISLTGPRGRVKLSW